MFAGLFLFLVDVVDSEIDIFVFIFSFTGSVWLWNGRPDWNQIFDQNADTPYVTTGIGVAFCGTPFIGKDLSKYCRTKSNSETGQVFHLLKENF